MSKQPTTARGVACLIIILTVCVAWRQVIPNDAAHPLPACKYDAEFTENGQVIAVCSQQLQRCATQAFDRIHMRGVTCWCERDAMSAPTAMALGLPLNLTQASAADLQVLPGIGAALSQRLVSYRDSHGFATLQSLRQVKGIGEKTLARLAPLLRVGMPHQAARDCSR